MTESSPVLGEGRVTLRPYSAGFSEEELLAIYRWGNDQELLNLSGGVPVRMAFAEFRRLFLSQAKQRNSATEQLFVILNEEGRLIGRTGLFAIDQRQGTAELGIVIGEHDCWGQRYGREAVRALVGFAFHHLGLRRVVLSTYPENQRARRSFAAAGFREVGTRRRFSFERGLHTEIVMEIAAEEHELLVAQ